MKKSAPIFKFGLKSRFISWFLLVSLIPLILFSYFSVNVATSYLKQEYLNKLSVSVQEKEEMILFLLEERFYGYSFLSSNQDVVDLFSVMVGSSEEHSPEEKTNAYVDLKTFLTKFGDSYGGSVESGGNLADIMVFDLQGNALIATYGIDEGGNEDEAEWFQEAIKGIYVGDLSFNEAMQQRTQIIAGPIYKDNQVIGVLQVETGIEFFDSVLEDAVGMGNTGEIFLVNKNKEMITNSRFKENSFGTKVVSEGVVAVMDGTEQHEYEYQNYRGKDVLSVVHQFGEDVNFQHDEFENEVNGLGWVIVGEVDKSEALLFVDQFVQRTLIVIGLSSLVIAFLSIFASNSISEYVRKPIKKAVLQLANAAEQLSSSSQQTSAASQQNSSIAQQVAAGAMQQSRQSEEVSQAIQQISSSIQQISASAQEASGVATRSADMAQEAGKSGQQSSQSLSNIKNVMADVSAMVKTTAEKSQAIRKIIESITDVAEQTNLLALNAAIEAARAGEAGRGFAVVSEEVGNLAEDSKKAAQEIAVIITDILAGIEETVTKTDESSKTIEDSSIVIGGTLDKLQNIAAAIQQISSKIQELSAATQQQSAGVQQISKVIDSIASVSQQNSAGAQQLSSSSQQQSAANQQVAAAAQQLLSLSEELQSMAGGLANQKKKIDSVIKTDNSISKKPAVPTPVSKPASPLVEPPKEKPESGLEIIRRRRRELAEAKKQQQATQNSKPAETNLS